MCGLHRVGRAPPARGADALRGFLYLPAKLSVPLAPLALLPPPRPLLLSSLSALFSGLITFRIKAKPSPGCEYNAPPSPLGEERGAGAPRGGRGRGRARRAARRRRGGRPGGGPDHLACVCRGAGGTRAPARGPEADARPGQQVSGAGKGAGTGASLKEGGEPERGLPLYLHFFFPKPHPPTSAGLPVQPESLPSWGRGVRFRVRVERSADSPGLS